MRVLAVVLCCLLPSALAAYAGPFPLLTGLGANTNRSCDVNFAHACSIATAASVNVAVVAALSPRAAQSTIEILRVLDHIREGRYTPPVSAAHTAFRPEVGGLPAVLAV